MQFLASVGDGDVCWSLSWYNFFKFMSTRGHCFLSPPVLSFSPPLLIVTCTPDLIRLSLQWVALSRSLGSKFTSECCSGWIWGLLISLLLCSSLWSTSCRVALILCWETLQVNDTTFFPRKSLACPDGRLRERRFVRTLHPTAEAHSFVWRIDQILISLLTLHVKRLERHSPRCLSLIPGLSRMHKVTWDLLVFELFRLFEFQHRLMTVSCSDIVT